MSCAKPSLITSGPGICDLKNTEINEKLYLTYVILPQKVTGNIIYLL
jgi:hypothetical protein